MKITTRNAKMVKALIKFINCMKDKCNQAAFKDYKETMIRITIEREKNLGNSEFEKELKKYIINEKINDIEKDFV